MTTTRIPAWANNETIMLTRMAYRALTSGEPVEVPFAGATQHLIREGHLTVVRAFEGYNVPDSVEVEMTAKGWATAAEVCANTVGVPADLIAAYRQRASSEVGR